MPRRFSSLAAIAAGLVLGLLPALSTHAREAVRLDAERSRYPLGRHLEVLEDPGKQWTFA